jgi:hypothetical protein
VLTLIDATFSKQSEAALSHVKSIVGSRVVGSMARTSARQSEALFNATLRQTLHNANATAAAPNVLVRDRRLAASIDDGQTGPQQLDTAPIVAPA